MTLSYLLRIRQMLDTMTVTKILGGFCGAFLIFLLGNWLTESIYHPGNKAHGEAYKQAYVIEVASGDETKHGDAVSSEPEVDVVALLASADIEKGQATFKKCKACHKTTLGNNGVGPYLYGVVGRAVDSAEGYKYSGKLAATTNIWTPEALNKFLENPKKYAPGTKMSFSGLKKLQDRINIIAYLGTLSDN